jgi:hypothetical protein
MTVPPTAILVREPQSVLERPRRKGHLEWSTPFIHSGVVDRFLAPGIVCFCG